MFRTFQASQANRKPLLYYSKLRNISTSPRHQNEPYKYERIKYYPRPYKEFCNEWHLSWRTHLMGAMYICICLTSFSWKMNALMLLKLQRWSLAIYGQVNLWGYCLNFCSEFLLNPIPAKQWEENLNTREVAKYCLLYTEISMCMHIRSADLQVETILISDQVHCQTKVSISTRTTNLQKCIYWGTFKFNKVMKHV